MKTYNLRAIGTVKTDGGNCCLVLDRRYAPALQGLEDFSHIQILWWFSECDNETDRNSLEVNAPYKSAPDVLGTFATRSPSRPNPLALSCAELTYIDRENATLGLTYIDAKDGSPVLDIKPYSPSLDRVEKPRTPKWCGHWPQNLEESEAFDWESEFNF